MTPEPDPLQPYRTTPGTADKKIANPVPAACPAWQNPRPPGAVDVFFFLIVCGLAFLLASTPARNSDLWLHLALGRHLAHGSAAGPASEPFSSTTAGVPWTDPTWLSDLLLYELYALGGGTALVAVKAGLVTVLAGLFFCFRRRQTRVGWLALAAGCAVLALGPWLLLQSLLFSVIGVVLTLWLLERPVLVEPSEVGKARTLRWLLVPLFALWANLDGWFLLGPVLVGLYALGSVLRNDELGMMNDESRQNPATSCPSFIIHRSSFILFAAVLAACLLTPAHYHAFAWPVPLGLTHAERAWMSDPGGQGLVVSPFGSLFRSSPVFASAGAWAYYFLLAAGAVSFALSRAWPAGRLLVWLALAALSAYQARTIPFFAAVAGPVLGLNLQEWARTLSDSEQRRRLEIAVRGVGVLAGLLLLVLAWPGWLGPAPYQPRAWTVEPDASLLRLAQQLETWHAQQKVRPDRFALTFSPEAAHYLAWFCPAEKGFVDSRWPLFDRVADDFVRMRQCLLEGSKALPPLLDPYQIDRIVLYDPDWGRTTRAYRSLFQSEGEWELLALEGGAALFGRRSSTSPWSAFDWKRAAYHPEPERRAPLTAPQTLPPPGLFDPFYQVPLDRSPDRAEAWLYLLTFDLLAPRRQDEEARAWLLALGAGLVGVGPEPNPGLPATLAVRLLLVPLPTPAPVAQQFALARAAFRDRGPPEALLLTIRAARRALAADPRDGGAWLLLAEAYLRLARQTAEQGQQTSLPLLGAIRKAQTITALEQAVLHRPNLDQAHALLAQLYYGSGQLDRALDHLRARLRISAEEAARGGEEGKLAAQRQTLLDSDVARLEALVAQAQQVYQGNVAGSTDPSKVYDRAQLAARHGLTRQALEMLLESHPAIFGKPGFQMQLRLMMEAGRAFEVRDWLEPDHEAMLGFSQYHALLAQAAAACGDYAGADAELDRLSDELRHVGVSRTQILPVRPAVGVQVAQAVLSGFTCGQGGPATLTGTAFLQYQALSPVEGAVALLRQHADLLVLRGLLAVEAGEMEAARGDLDTALGEGLDFPARPLAQQIRSRMKDEG
jgi:tetratricopeptide (TPR) repeat protein